MKTITEIADIGPMHDSAHPGEILAELVLPEKGLSAEQAAKEAGIPTQAFFGILDGTVHINQDFAELIGKWLGTGSSLWLELQEHFNEWHAKQEAAGEPR